jgi:hypothetical protein
MPHSLILNLVPSLPIYPQFLTGWFKLRIFVKL